MKSSIYCLPADILGEGAELVLGNILERARISGVTVAASYHASHDVYPHNPASRVASMAPGAFYRSDAAAYPDRALGPTVSSSAGGRDILEEACVVGERLEMDVSAWAVFLHRDDLPAAGSALQVSCFGDCSPGLLCPANPAVRHYVITMTRELCQYPIAALRAEALHYQGVLHGAHHERCLDDYGELATLLLGICFCDFCQHEAVRHGVDALRLAARCRRYLIGVFDSDTPPHVADAESISAACGDEIFTYLSARGTTVTRLAQEVAKESVAAGVRLSFIDQTIPARSYATGRYFRSGRDAVRWELGVEPSELAEAGVPLEVPAYLARLEDVSLAVDWYREQVVDPEGLSIVLRPGPPDLNTHGGLADKIAYAAGLGCAEVNFYAYGLYRLRSLDLIHAALRSWSGASNHSV